MPRGSFSIRRLTEYWDEGRDYFNRLITNEFTDLIDVPGEHDFTPERLRYYKDGTRRFLQYGSDGNYMETNTGHLLEPNSGQTLRLETAERAAYPVGFDMLPSMARRITQDPQAGDVIGGGYGNLDLDNFQPSTVSYADGSTADGWFWYHTADTGRDECILAGVRDGTVYYDTGPVKLQKAASTLTLLEMQLNWYGVGPAITREYFTDIEDYPDDPFRRHRVGAVAADDGKSAALASHRVQLGIKQASGNSGLGVEAGSMSVKLSGDPNYQYKSKGHSMDLENTNTVLGEYQVCGALRIDPSRPEIKVRINDLDIISTPGSATNNARVLIMSVDPSETDISPSAFSTPVEHNAANSVVEEVEDNTALGPDIDGSEDASGASLSNIITNPGGYQIGRESVTPEGTGAASVRTTGEQIGKRNLYDRDWALLLVDSDTAGTCEIDVNTTQNS